MLHLMQKCMRVAAYYDIHIAYLRCKFLVLDIAEMAQAYDKVTFLFILQILGVPVDRSRRFNLLFLL